MYLSVIVLGEVLTALGAAPVGMLIWLALLAILPLHAAFVASPLSSLLTALTLIPLIRVVSLALPLASFTLPGAYLLTSFPVLIGVAATIWVLKLSPSQVGLRVGKPLAQVGIAMLGVPLGLVEYVTLGPISGTPGGPVLAIVFGIILVLFVAFVEELVYRGVVQAMATAALGRRFGPVFTSLLFATAYLGNGST